MIGEGPPDLVQVGIALTHVEIGHELAANRRVFERIASFARLIDYDRRGSGISDRTVGAVPIEVEVEDLLAILDAVGSDRPYLFGVGVGGSLSLVFAAVHPDRCAGVIAYSTPACFLRSDDYPYGWDEQTFEMFLQLIDDGGLAGPDALRIVAPSMADDREYVDFIARMLRSATTPRQARDCFETYARTDIRNVLVSVKVPVLVVHRTGDRLFPIGQSRDLAKRLPDARFAELPGDDWTPWVGDTDSLLTEIQAFVTGTRPTGEPDRQLATVLFTDVVKSTETVASIGDKRWRELLDRHDDIVLREVERHGGRQVKTTGDGVLATFNGLRRASEPHSRSETRSPASVCLFGRDCTPVRSRSEAMMSPASPSTSASESPTRHEQATSLSPGRCLTSSQDLVSNSMTGATTN
jgi:pimeloyl-ACP methyl ester carboxylesterase